MVSSFSFPTKIRFGAGVIQELPEHLTTLGMKKPLIVTDPGLLPTNAFKKLDKISNGRWPVFSGVHPNPTIEDVEAATKAYQENQCDSVIAFGGGSALDVGKVIRMCIKRPEKPLIPFEFGADWSGLVPCITIPTTAGTGSEVGRSSVIIKDGRKQVIFHPSLLASLVILDPELTVGLPPKLTAATGADALIHCIESVTSPVFHPMCDGIALEGIHLISQSLVKAVKNGKDIEARGRMLVAAMMGAVAFQKDLGAIHSLAHPLSTFCGLHHGTANALCTSVVMQFNASKLPGVYRRVGIALGLNNPDDATTIKHVSNLLCEIGLEPGLRAYGVKESQLDAMSDQAFADGCHQTNPVPVTRDDLRRLYQQAL
ncbi:iron-containing alcohol dehydrogenase [Pedosphaera parvula]|uniref:Iron-containing alcohol dehydrogenase n=1 Tax=Pedosphaera parvula (strain Ellin514) TaxID=320771 RepID=B9XLU8_PEDPL|nr:iron-containing alcohol dehydrogenase [Pedosphaera parvula]EEF59205.1 iron-containing alcohol dehydrogenase [Pedosphaera parvula Ellin514]